MKGLVAGFFFQMFIIQTGSCTRELCSFSGFKAPELEKNSFFSSLQGYWDSITSFKIADGRRW